MKRKDINSEISKRALQSKSLEKFKRIVFLDTETTKSLMETKHGIEWYDEIVSVQAYILPEKEKHILLTEPAIHAFLNWLAKQGESTLVVGYNLEYDLTAVYRNLYSMELPTRKDYNCIKAFNFKVLDLMISYDMMVASLFGKKDKDKIGLMNPDIVLTNLPLREGKNGNTAEGLFTYLESMLKQIFGDYVVLKKTRHVCQRELEERAERGVESEPSGASCQFFTTLAISISVVKKLKDVIGVILPSEQRLNLEKDDGWVNFGRKEGKKYKFKEFNYLIGGEHAEGIAERMLAARDHNMKIVNRAIQDRIDGKENAFLRYAELDIDYLLVLFHSLNYPAPDYVHDEVLCQARLHYVGIPIDSSKIMEQIEELQTLEAATQEAANEAFLGEINLKSSKQKKLLLRLITGLPEDEIKSTDRKYIARLVSEGLILEEYKELAKSLTMRGQEDFLRTQLQSVAACGSSGVHPTEILGATSTYRKSAVGGLNTAGIQKNDGLRSSFSVHACGDQKSAEVTALAASIQDSCWQEFLEEDVDTHSLVASLILGWDYEKVMDCKADEKAGKTKYKVVSAVRDKVKAVTFALFYGGTVEGISQKTDISEEKVREVMNLLQTTFPRFSGFRCMTDDFNVFQQIAQDWNSIDDRIAGLPTSVTNMMGVSSYAYIPKICQEILSSIKNTVRQALDRQFAGELVIRDTKKDRPQTLGGAYYSALLGSISEMQGRTQRRMGNFPIQSSVAFITKYMKSAIYRRFKVAVHDVHDEILIPASENLDKEEFETFFKAEVRKIRTHIPAFGWDIDTSGKWVK